MKANLIRLLICLSILALLLSAPFHTLPTGAAGLAPENPTSTAVLGPASPAFDLSLYLPLIIRPGIKQNYPPEVPFEPQPAAGVRDQPIVLVLSWTDSEWDWEELTFDVYLATRDDDPKEPNVLVADNLSSTSYELGPLVHNTHYFWRVVAYDRYGNYVHGPVWDFFTRVDPSEQRPPQIPYNPDPLDGEHWLCPPFWLEWYSYDPDGDAVTYDVYLDDGGSYPVRQIANDLQDHYAWAGDLEYEWGYSWVVIATDEHGASTEGPVWRFSTGSQWGEECN